MIAGVFFKLLFQEIMQYGFNIQSIETKDEDLRTDRHMMYEKMEKKNETTLLDRLIQNESKLLQHVHNE